MQEPYTELKPGEEKQGTAQAATGGETPALSRQTVSGPHPSRESEARQTPAEEPARVKPTPVELCFSLWVKGFLNGALSINIILGTVSFIGLAIILGYLYGTAEPVESGGATRRSPQQQFLVNLMTLLAAFGTFSFISTASLAVMASVRFMFLRFSVIGVMVVIAGVAVYLLLSFQVLPYIAGLDAPTRYGIIAASVILAMVLVVLGTGAKHALSDREGERKRAPRVGIKVALAGFFSGQWVPGLREDVEKIHRRNKEEEEVYKKVSTSPLNYVPRADIAGDFKAWNDATKLLLTVLTGLTVLASLFSNGNSTLEQTIKIIALLSLLVPGLACAYMEAFKRQCERQWLIVEEISKRAAPGNDSQKATHDELKGSDVG